MRVVSPDDELLSTIQTAIEVCLSVDAKDYEVSEKDPRAPNATGFAAGRAPSRPGAHDGMQLVPPVMPLGNVELLPGRMNVGGQGALRTQST